MSLLAESPGDLVLEVLHGGPTGFDAGFALPGQHDELGAPVTRVGSSYHLAQGLELVDKLPHGMWAHVRAASEFREPRAGRVDLRRVCLKRMGHLGNREVPLRLLSRPPVLTVSDFYSYRLR